ncbi:hypothetical protein [Cylindrospermum sp. FACHB-282]|uniref:hypothetical protein n=1 Tax=Cylindrospermum sp. FACHB-282 TaxID=2692794 RepID=UPI001683AAFF|nr:hypothetical protein [Cylindrospermum sp. FACHB-282]MBD2385672.1 hypothetical protein [Cylindrospermum sp. FACHB-282]
MSNQNINPNLLVDLTTEQQQLLAGGCGSYRKPKYRYVKPVGNNIASAANIGNNIISGPVHGNVIFT